MIEGLGGGCSPITVSDHPPKPPSLRAAFREWKRARAQARIDAQFKTPRLTADELKTRFDLNSPAVVEEVHSIAVRLLEGEEARHARLVEKAHALLGTAGLSLTAASAFAPILQAHLSTWSLIVYGVALLLGLLATIKAVQATRVTALYRGVDERDILNPVALSTADLFVPEQPAVDSTTPQRPPTPSTYGDAEAQRRSAYRSYVSIQYWRIWQQHFGIHEIKASQIKRGQTYFLGFLMSLIVVGAIMGYAAYSNPSTLGSGQCQNQKQTSPSPSRNLSPNANQ